MPTVAALRAGVRDCVAALFGEHFNHIEERHAQGIIERSEREIEEALRPVSQRADGVGRTRRKGREPASAPAS
jgi:hypothetical protein